MNYHNEKMAKNIAEKLQVDEEQALSILNEYWKDKIAVIWCIEDVQDRFAQNTGHILDDETAKDVLDQLKHYHDCNYGITWDTIDCHLDDL